MILIKESNREKGGVLVYLLCIVFIFSLLMLPIINVIAKKLKILSTAIDNEQALQIAESGINYYQWHLAHFPNDFKDGTNTAGPYIHDYKDYDIATTTGRFSLAITAPSSGSTIVTIESTGYTLDKPTVKRVVTVKYGIPSLAQYSFLSNDIIWIGDGETVSGQMQSNGGIRFDGVGNAPIQSAKSTYTCSSNQGSPCPATKNGVWGSAAQATKNFWQFPVPAVDFSTVTSNLATLKSSAQSGGIYLPPSSAQGYSFVFNNNGTVSIYKVTSLLSDPTGYDVNGVAHNEDIDYNARTKLDGNTSVSGVQDYTLPANGIIYAEDKAWVEGVVKGRVMLAAALLPYNANSAPVIYIPNNITYLAKDGTNVLGLLSQKDIIVTYNAPTNLEIDAALIAQNGSAQFFGYASGAVKNSITVYGSIMTFGQWTWTWVDSSNNVTSGYTTTNSTYDANLLYASPPSFPLSSSGYQQLNWSSN